jgi:hypothetical protein
MDTKAHGYTVVEGSFFGAGYTSMAISMIGIELMEKVEGHPPCPSRRQDVLAAMRHLLHPRRWIYRSMQDRGSGAAGAPPPPGASSIGRRSSMVRGARARACPRASRQGGALRLAPPWPPPRGLSVDPETERKAAMYRERRPECGAGDRAASRQQRWGRRVRLA